MTNLIAKNSKGTWRLESLNTLLLMLLLSNFSPDLILIRIILLIRKKFRTTIREEKIEKTKSSMPTPPLKLFKLPKLLNLLRKLLTRPRMIIQRIMNDNY